MGTLFFIARCFAVTIVVILAMQIKIGEHTIEYRIDNMVRTSGIERPAQTLADGIVRFVRNTWNGISGKMGDGVGRTFRSDSAPGNRNLGIDLNRSAEYIREQANKASTKVKSHLREEGIITDDP